MRISAKKLNKLEFKVEKDLSEYEKRFVSNYIADKLTNKYPYLKIGYFDIFSILYNTPMYYSKIPENISNVNYLYKDMSLHFSQDKNVFNIDEFILHEAIHRIQDKRKKNGNLMSLGLCRFTDTKVKGLYLNEAAVQYIVSDILEKDKSEIKICNILLRTRSASYYPLITHLIEQIVLLVGERLLVQSTILSDNDFSYEAMDYFGEKNFENIVANLDKIMELRQNVCEQNKEENIKQINHIYYETQKIIYTNYFNRIIVRIDKIDEIEEIKQQLYQYAKMIYNSGKYEEFKMFYNDKIKTLRELEININAKYALTTTNNNILYKVFLKIRKLLYKGTVDNSTK